MNTLLNLLFLDFFKLFLINGNFDSASFVVQSCDSDSLVVTRAVRGERLLVWSLLCFDSQQIKSRMGKSRCHILFMWTVRTSACSFYTKWRLAVKLIQWLCGNNVTNSWLEEPESPVRFLLSVDVNNRRIWRLWDKTKRGTRCHSQLLIQSFWDPGPDAGADGNSFLVPIKRVLWWTFASAPSWSERGDEHHWTFRFLLWFLENVAMKTFLYVSLPMNPGCAALEMFFFCIRSLRWNAARRFLPVLF